MSNATIVDVEGLLSAIRAVARGGEDYDQERAGIITSAKGLGHPDLIPDNWDTDGSLADRSGVWEDEEQRETYGDLSRALSDALCEQLDGYCYMTDFDQENVYYIGPGCTYSVSYSIADDGPVTLGEPQRVRPVTTYVPATRSEAPPKRPRLATRTLEWRRERASALSDLQRKRPDRRPLAAPLELREEADSPTVTLRSYASLFDTPYTVGTGEYKYQETVERTAFKRTLAAKPDVVLRTEHSGPPLAATYADSLRLGTDERGLWYEADLQRDDPDVQSLLPKVRRGDLRESSFAFRCIEDAWNDDYSERALRACELDRGDVSIVTFGASRATGRFMTLRSEEAVAALRSVGFETFLQAWVEWRNYTLLTPEQRAGKILSATSMETLRRVLDLISAADDAVDDAQPLLADLMGVPNPDADEEEGEEDGEDDPDDSEQNAESEESVATTVPTPLPVSRVAEFEAELRMIGGR